jgi:Spy/CpxP family protein refolding chaperone
MNRTFAFLSLAALFAAAPALRAQAPGGQQPPAAPAPSAPSQPAPAAPAQQPGQPPAAEAEQGAPLSKLGLSDEQKKQIHDIRQQSQQQVQVVRNDTSLTPQQQTQQIRQIRHKAAQQVDGVLTPEQRAKFDAWRRAHQRHHHPAHGQPA